MESYEQITSHHDTEIAFDAGTNENYVANMAAHLGVTENDIRTALYQLTDEVSSVCEGSIYSLPPDECNVEVEDDIVAAASPMSTAVDFSWYEKAPSEADVEITAEDVSWYESPPSETNVSVGDFNEVVNEDVSWYESPPSETNVSLSDWNGDLISEYSYPPSENEVEMD